MHSILRKQHREGNEQDVGTYTPEIFSRFRSHIRVTQRYDIY
jgi:hypothetical protein